MMMPTSHSSATTTTISFWVNFRTLNIWMIKSLRKPPKNMRNECGSSGHPTVNSPQSKSYEHLHKIKVAHYINTSDDEHIKLVTYFQKRKENRNLKSVFKDAKRYAEELQLDCQFNKEATVIRHVNQIAVVNGKDPKTSKKFYEKPQSRRGEPKSWTSSGLENM